MDIIRKLSLRLKTLNYLASSVWLQIKFAIIFDDLANTLSEEKSIHSRKLIVQLLEASTQFTRKLVLFYIGGWMFNVFNIYSDPWMNCQGWVDWPGPGWKRDKQWRISSSGSGKEDLKFKSHNNGNGGTFSIWMNETTKSNLCWHVGGNLKNFLQLNLFCRHLILFRKQCIFPFLTLAMYSYGQHLATSTTTTKI